jgi:hypothetical protein
LAGGVNIPEKQTLFLIAPVSGCISGLLLVISGQLTRAIVDNTDNTGMILSILKNLEKR